MLLGNIAWSGGGVVALCGHQNMQGSSDIQTLFNILPGYVPMPHPRADNLDEFVVENGPETGAWGDLKKYMVSFLRSWWGEAATEENDWAFQYLPKNAANHANYTT